VVANWQTVKSPIQFHPLSWLFSIPSASSDLRDSTGICAAGQGSKTPDWRRAGADSRSAESLRLFLQIRVPSFTATTFLPLFLDNTNRLTFHLYLV
jgi:hypothetical protein